MISKIQLAIIAGSLAIVSGPGFAQSVDEGRVRTAIGIDPLDERIEDIEEDVADDFAQGQDAARFGSVTFPQGFSGSISGSATATSGNTDTTDVTIGGRLRYGAAPWAHSFGVALEYGDSDGDTDTNNVFATYEALRDFGNNFYVFGLGRYEYDEFGPFEHDAFLGFGPGYRVINQPNQAWRLQAGPGVRYTNDQADNEETEASLLASSRYYLRLNETSFLTNDTDVLYSDVSTLVTNDFGITTRLTDSLSARASLRTEYDTDPAPGIDDTDNRIGIAVVYAFD